MDNNDDGQGDTVMSESLLGIEASSLDAIGNSRPWWRD
jgi:hypothetical protein